MAESEWLLCGTSFLSDLEWRALKAARHAGKKTVSVIDHWVNYRQRFTRHGEWCFPDEAWLGDEIGLDMARRDLPEVPLRLVPNAYFLDLHDELAALAVPSRSSGPRVLYVTEPLRDDGLALHGDAYFLGYTEEDALRYFLDNVRLLGPVERIAIRAIRRNRGTSTCGPLANMNCLWSPTKTKRCYSRWRKAMWSPVAPAWRWSSD